VGAKTEIELGDIWPPGNGRMVAAQVQTQRRSLGRTGRKRNVFSEFASWFAVPTALYHSGLMRKLSPCARVRYITFCRLANYRSSYEISCTLRELETMDSVSPRAARHAHCKLEEYGLIHVSNTKPITYRVEPNPANWKVNFQVKPALKNRSRLTVEL
jgi:hypothetical protein